VPVLILVNRTGLPAAPLGSAVPRLGQRPSWPALPALRSPHDDAVVVGTAATAVTLQVGPREHAQGPPRGFVCSESAG
jgi:hypothetical protein